MEVPQATEHTHAYGALGAGLNAGAWLVASIPGSAWSVIGGVLSTFLVSVVVPVLAAMAREWIVQPLRRENKRLRDEVESLKRSATTESAS